MAFRKVGAALTLAAPLVLGGCVVPPALTVASYVADGISYLASGKSLEDHALSTVVDEDCALHRVITAEPICSDDKAPDATQDVAMNKAVDPTW